MAERHRRYAAAVYRPARVEGLREAHLQPVKRWLTVGPTDWPTDAPPLTIALLSDIHLGNRAMDEERLSRIVSEVNGARPDLVLLAGDLVIGHELSSSVSARSALSVIWLSGEKSWPSLFGSRSRPTTTAVLPRANILFSRLGRPVIVVADRVTIRNLRDSAKGRDHIPYPGLPTALTRYRSAQPRQRALLPTDVPAADSLAAPDGYPPSPRHPGL